MVVGSSESGRMDLDMVLVPRSVDIVRMDYRQVEVLLVHILLARVDILPVVVVVVVVGVVVVVMRVEVGILNSGLHSME